MHENDSRQFEHTRELVFFKQRIGFSPSYNTSEGWKKKLNESRLAESRSFISEESRSFSKPAGHIRTARSLGPFPEENDEYESRETYDQRFLRARLKKLGPYPASPAPAPQKRSASYSPGPGYQPMYAPQPVYAPQPIYAPQPVFYAPSPPRYAPPHPNYPPQEIYQYFAGGYPPAQPIPDPRLITPGPGYVRMPTSPRTPVGQAISYHQQYPRIRETAPYAPAPYHPQTPPREPRMYSGDWYGNVPPQPQAVAHPAPAEPPRRGRRSESLEAVLRSRQERDLSPPMPTVEERPPSDYEDYAPAIPYDEPAEFVEEAPPRKRGRPRRGSTSDEAGTVDDTEVSHRRSESTGRETSVERRKPGRPRRSSLSDIESSRLERRKPGRPRASSVSDVDESLIQKLRNVGKKAPVVQDLAIPHERKTRRTQPKNRRETFVEVAPAVGKRLRVAPVRSWMGERYVRARDGSIIGMAGYVDSQTPKLPEPVIYHTPEADRKKRLRKAKQARPIHGPLPLSERGWPMLGNQEVVAPASLRSWVMTEISPGFSVPFSQGVTLAERVMVAEIRLLPGGLKERELVNQYCGIDITILECAEGDPVEICVDDGKKHRLGKFGCMVAYPNQSYSILNISKKSELLLKLVIVRKQPLPQIGSL